MPCMLLGSVMSKKFSFVLNRKMENIKLGKVHYPMW